jgi:hypothetical protein
VGNGGDLMRISPRSIVPPPLPTMFSGGQALLIKPQYGLRKTPVQVKRSRLGVAGMEVLNPVVICPRTG